MKHFSFTKKFLSFFLLLAMTLPLAVACNDKQRETTDEGIVLLKEPVVLADSAGAYYNVVAPNKDTDVLLSCVSSLTGHEGFRLTQSKVKSDGSDETAKEILIGNTPRSQSVTAMNATGFDGFSITLIDEKIVIAAHTPERLTEAVDFMKQKLLRVTDGRLEYIGDYTYESESPLMIDDGESVADYKIVCGHDDLYVSAQNVQKYVKDKYGVQLEIIYDTKPKDGKEIVLGNSKRDISALTDSLGIGEGIIAVKDKDLLIAAKDVTSTSALLDMFADEYLSGTYTDAFNFKADTAITVNTYDGVFKDSASRAKNSDLRVMSFNVLCDIWKDTPSISGRDTTVIKTLLCYAPDVVGFQEASSSWHRSLKTNLKDTPYKLICTERSVTHEKYGNLNFTPILYNSDVLTLKDSGIKEFENKGNQYMKTIAWAIFEINATKQQFVLVNTHYEAPGNDAEEKAENLEYRKKQTAEMIEFVSYLEETYDLPVMLTGDFNTTEGNDKTGHHSPYWNLINSGLHDAKSSADKIVRAPQTWHELGSSVSSAPGGSFDHIFGNEKIKFVYFNTLIDKMLMTASDHCPIYADVKFN